MFQQIIILSILGLVYGQFPYLTHHNLQYDGRIIGGKDATIEEHPYQLSFQVFNTHYCGAALYKSNIAITAAHCTEEVHQYLENLSVRAGSSFTDKDGQVARVISICDHPLFNGSYSKDYDISVLLLDRSLVLSSSVQTISLQPVNVDTRPGDIGRISGWGVMDEAGTLFPTVLQALDVPRIDQKTCERYYIPRDISNRMFCFGYAEGGKDGCQGDSGGPLVLNGRLIGVISWGFGCARPEFPGVYTKISDPDINGHINKCAVKFKLTVI